MTKGVKHLNPHAILSGRAKQLPGFAYKLNEGNQYGYDVPMSDTPDIDENEMSVVIPFADGNRRDGVGDLLEVAGINTSRHRTNPCCLFDHGKQVTLPIGMAENPHTKAYAVFIDAVAKTAHLTCYFYRGKGLQGVEKAADYDHAIFCEQLFDLTAKRYLRSGSIGYQIISAYPLQADYNMGTPQGMHLLKTLMLEGSLVVMPCNADTVRKALCLSKVCGKPMSPMLVKSLTPYAPPRKAQLGYEGKAKGDKIRVRDNGGIRFERVGTPLGLISYEGVRNDPMAEAQNLVQVGMNRQAEVYGDEPPRAVPDMPYMAVGKDGAPEIIDERTQKAVGQKAKVRYIATNPRPDGTFDVTENRSNGGDSSKTESVDPKVTGHTGPKDYLDESVHIAQQQGDDAVGRNWTDKKLKALRGKWKVLDKRTIDTLYQQSKEGRIDSSDQNVVTDAVRERLNERDKLNLSSADYAESRNRGLDIATAERLGEPGPYPPTREQLGLPPEDPESEAWRQEYIRNTDQKAVGSQLKVPQGNPLSRQNVPPARWKPGAGAIKALRAKYKGIDKPTADARAHAVRADEGSPEWDQRYSEAQQLAQDRNLSEQDIEDSFEHGRQVGMVQWGQDNNLPEGIVPKPATPTREQMNLPPEDPESEAWRQRYIHNVKAIRAKYKRSQNAT